MRRRCVSTLTPFCPNMIVKQLRISSRSPYSMHFAHLLIHHLVVINKPIVKMKTAVFALSALVATVAAQNSLGQCLVRFTAVRAMSDERQTSDIDNRKIARTG